MLVLVLDARARLSVVWSWLTTHFPDVVRAGKDMVRPLRQTPGPDLGHPMAGRAAFVCIRLPRLGLIHTGLLQEL